MNNSGQKQEKIPTEVLPKFHGRGTDGFAALEAVVPKPWKDVFHSRGTGAETAVSISCSGRVENVYSCFFIKSFLLMKPCINALLTNSVALLTSNFLNKSFL